MSIELIDISHDVAPAAPKSSSAMPALDLATLEGFVRDLLMRDATKRHYVFRFCYNNSLVILLVFILIQIMVCFPSFSLATD